MKREIKDILPGYRINEYLLVLNPHRELSERISKVKEEFFDKYQAESARWGRPQVPLANFVQYAMMEERIINRLQNLAMGFYPSK